MKNSEKQVVKPENSPDPIYPSALTVAGSDSGGGAGIEADLRTFNALAVFGCAAVTAVTAQNPTGVRRVDALPPDGVVAQIEAVLDLIPVRAAKTGMLANPEIAEAVAAAWRKRRIPLVVDPVMVATSGARLLAPEAIEVIRQQLLVQAAWITPNLPEAELLLGKTLRTETDFRAAARELSDRFGAAVLLKTGHAEGLRAAIDFVRADNRDWKLVSVRVPLDKYTAHGTGCTLSAAMTAALAAGESWQDALVTAKSFVLGSLAEPVALAPGIPAMYPPESDYRGEVRLEPLP